MKYSLYGGGVVSAWNGQRGSVTVLYNTTASSESLLGSPPRSLTRHASLRVTPALVLPRISSMMLFPRITLYVIPLTASHVPYSILRRMSFLLVGRYKTPNDPITFFASQNSPTQAHMPRQPHRVPCAVEHPAGHFFFPSNHGCARGTIPYFHHPVTFPCQASCS
jgi:hypothetical protein